MRYLLDTSALIRFVRGYRGAVQRIEELGEQGETLGCCAVVVAEFYSGVSYGFRPHWDALLDSLEFWGATRTTAMRAATYRRNARRANHTLSVTDTLIAAVAYEHDAVVLTANPRDFPMDDVRVEALP